MNKPRLTLIVARSHGGIIGKDGSLPWHIPEDLRYFKQKTIGSPIIMGRKTFESIGRPLPGRLNIVLTRQLNASIKDCIVLDSIESALQVCKDFSDCFVIGGCEIFSASLPFLDRVLITEIDAFFPGDCSFNFSPSAGWVMSSKQTQKTVSPNGFNITFFEYVKTPGIIA